MTPYEQTSGLWTWPFPLYEFQSQAVNELAPLDKSALFLSPGLGKTPTATHCALYKLSHGTEVVLLILPPILIPMWVKWLAKIKHVSGKSLKVLAYRGTPTERKAMGFDVDFVIMSLDIFKRDISRITAELSHKRTHCCIDEAHSLKNISSQNYKLVRDFTMDQTLQILTGTPLTTPLDAYAYSKLISPSIYRNYAQFLQLFVKEKDFFGNAVEFQNLDLLASNLQVNAVLKTKEEVLLDLPECIITNLEYDLSKQHMALYRRLVEEQLLKLPDGEKIDATTSSALRHALSQIIMQFGYFAQDEKLKAAGYEMIEEVITELGGRKLIVFAVYRRTIEELVRRFGCPCIYGGLNAKDKEVAWDKFLNDPSCSLIALNAQAAGIGLDGAQHVCADVLYCEPPIAVSHLVQSLSRVHRDGQRNVVTVRLMSALGTIHQHQIRSLSDKEALVQPLQGSKAMLRAALFGEVCEAESCRVIT